MGACQQDSRQATLPRMQARGGSEHDGTTLSQGLLGRGQESLRRASSFFPRCTPPWHFAPRGANGTLGDTKSGSTPAGRLLQLI